MITHFNCLPSHIRKLLPREQDISNAIVNLTNHPERESEFSETDPQRTDVLDYALGVVDGGEKASSPVEMRAAIK